jgi:3-deoxy-manno-octulosonate cytidylyltransferase (CMP-KDO synthetase)
VERRVLGVIPARFASSRLPGKPLADLGGRPLVVRVLEGPGRAKGFDRVVVATDDERIATAVTEAGGESRLTPGDLPSGSDRAAFTARLLENEGEQFDVVVNLQGDEPFLPPEAVDAALDVLARTGADIATLAAPLAPGDRDREQVVKVAVLGERAREFSRDADRLPAGEMRRHLGLYAYRREALDRFVGLPPSDRERKERLEQLRALDDGMSIAVAVGDWPAFGVDTPEDLDEARRRLAGTT